MPRMAPRPPALSRRQLLLVGCAACAPRPAAAAEALRVLVDNAIEMPQALILGQEVTEGLQYQVALELGRRLDRPVVFRPVPRRRLALMLAAGEGDLACNYLPEWLPGGLQWSQPFMDSGDALVTAERTPAPQRLAELAGQRLGTIAGFRYPEVEAALGTGFVRDDAPNLSSSLRKLAAGRIEHIIVGQTTFDYLKKRGDVAVPTHPPLPLNRTRTSCALSPQSSLALPALDAALTAMQADGSMRRILDRYR